MQLWTSIPHPDSIQCLKRATSCLLDRTVCLCLPLASYSENAAFSEGIGRALVKHTWVQLLHPEERIFRWSLYSEKNLSWLALSLISLAFERLLNFFNFVYMGVLSACLSVHHMMQCLGRPGEGLRSPGTGVTTVVGDHVGPGIEPWSSGGAATFLIY